MEKLIKGFVAILSITLLFTQCEKNDDSKDIFLSDGLAAYYPFSGNALDMSGNEFHGNVSGATLTKDRFGDDYCAYQFWDSDDVIALDTGIYRIDVITISAWIKRLGDGDDWAGWSVVVGGDCGTPYLAFEYGYLTFGAQCGFPIDHFYAETSLDDQDWHQIVGVFDGDSIKLYMDGNQLVNTEAYDGHFEESMQLGIGAAFGHGRNTENFNGMIDDVRIYTRALTVKEVEALFHEES